MSIKTQYFQIDVEIQDINSSSGYTKRWLCIECKQTYAVEGSHDETSHQPVDFI